MKLLVSSRCDGLLRGPGGAAARLSGRLSRSIMCMCIVHFCSFSCESDMQLVFCSRLKDRAAAAHGLAL